VLMVVDYKGRPLQAFSAKLTQCLPIY